MPLPPVVPPMTRMESWLIGTTAVESLAVVSEAVFFQELGTGLLYLLLYLAVMLCCSTHKTYLFSSKLCSGIKIVFSHIYT